MPYSLSFRISKISHVREITRSVSLYSYETYFRLWPINEEHWQKLHNNGHSANHKQRELL
jgi:hypothetical protein